MAPVGYGPDFQAIVAVPIRSIELSYEKSDAVKSPTGTCFICSFVCPFFVVIPSELGDDCVRFACAFPSQTLACFFSFRSWRRLWDSPGILSLS